MRETILDGGQETSTLREGATTRETGSHDGEKERKCREKLLQI